MNYLTTHYKNLAEQLQEKVNHLQNLISEAQKETEDVIIDDAERDEGEYHPTLQGHLAKGKGSKRGRQVNVEPGRAIPGVSKETEIGDAHELADDDADKNNIYKTGKAIKVNKSEIKRVQEKVNHLNRLIEAEDLGVKDVDGDGDRDAQDVILHNSIVADIARHQGSLYPHVTAHIGGGPFDTEKSTADILKTLSPVRPMFKSVTAALAHVKDKDLFMPHTLQGPSGYAHEDDDTYEEMLKDVAHNIATEKINKKSADAYQAERAKHLKAGTYES